MNTGEEVAYRNMDDSKSAGSLKWLFYHGYPFTQVLFLELNDLQIAAWIGEILLSYAVVIAHIILGEALPIFFKFQELPETR